MEENLSFYDLIKNEFRLNEIDTGNYSPIVLAYMGDVVLEIVIRTILVNKYSNRVSNINAKSSFYVKAKTQSTVARIFLNEDIFTEEEKKVYRRGRNANSGSAAKNVSLSEYKMSTGFESVLGYLYLNNKNDRIIKLLHKYVEINDNKKEDKN